MNRARLAAHLETAALAALAVLMAASVWPHTIALRNAAYGVMIVALIAARRLAGRPLGSASLFVRLLAAEGITLIPSVLLAADRGYALKMFWKEYLWLFGLFVATAALAGSLARVERLIDVLVASTGLLAGFGVYGFLTLTQVSEDLRATSAFLSPTRAGYAVAVVFAAAFMAFFRARSVRRQAFLAAALVLYVCYLFVTYSRGAWLGVFAALTLAGLLHDRRILIFLLVILILSPLVMPERVVDRALSSIDLARFRDTAVGGDRYWLLLASRDMIRDHPLFGIGYGRRSFEAVYPRYRYPESSQPSYYHCHNLFCQVVVERGLVGAPALLAIFGAALAVALALARRGVDRTRRNLGVGFLGAVAAFLTIGLVTYRYDAEMSNVFWFFLGLLAAVRAWPEEAAPIAGTGAPEYHPATPAEGAPAGPRRS